MDFGVHLGPVPPSRHTWDHKLEPRRSIPEQKLILDGFGDHPGGHPGSFWSSFSDMFGTKGVSCCELFWQPLPERLQDKFGGGKLTKSYVFGRAWKWLNCLKCCTDLIFACFLSDALPRPVLGLNFEGFAWIGVHVGSLCTFIWVPDDIFLGNVCAIELLLGFFCNSGAGGGSQGKHTAGSPGVRLVTF